MPAQPTPSEPAPAAPMLEQPNLTDLTSHTDDDVSAHTGSVEVTAKGWTWQHADRASPALAGLDLTIAPGERVLLAGPSGAGKSTLLHGLAGVLHDEEAQCSGELLLDGRTPDESRGRAGLVQQDPEAQVVLSRIGDDVAFAAENLTVPPTEIHERTLAALAAVGLVGLDPDHPTAWLSGGQKQRLALAGVLAMRPGLLLLDEPTANLDPDGVTQVREAVLSAATLTGATVIIVEHRLEVWADDVDTLLVLEPGAGLHSQVPASALHDDAGLREELTRMGLWVPGRDPLAGLPRWTRQTGSPPSRSPSLMSAEGISVSRTSPKGSWRRVPASPPTLSGVDLTLRSASALGITGRNGAGKSTLLLTLAGLLPAHGGRIAASEQIRSRKASGATLLPENPFQWRSADLIARIGMVFQEPEHQFVRPTVREELALGASEARQPGNGEPLFTEQEISTRVEHLLSRLRLEQLAEANPFTLSGGEKRRLSVGTVLSAGPEILMLDEPTFGQDAATFAELITLLREHLDGEGTVVAVTHDEAFLNALQAERYDAGGDDADSSLTTDRAVQEGSAPRRAGEKPVTSGGTNTEPQPKSEPEPPGRATPPMLGGRRSTSWLGRRNALAKLIALVFITAALVATIDWVSSAVVIAASFLLLPAAGIRVLTFLRRIWIFAVGAVIAAWGTAVAAEESGRVLLDFGLTTVSEGSVALGVALGLRAFAIVLPSVIVFSTTDPTDLADSLAQQLRLPARFVLGALAAMRLLGLLAEHWTTLGHARRARGIGAQGRAGKKLRSTLSQGFGLLVQAIRTATRLAVTMEARGFGAGERTWARRSHFRPADLPVMAGGLVIGGIATWAAVTAGVWNLVWT